MQLDKSLRPFVDFIILMRHVKTLNPGFAPSATEGQSPDTSRFLSHRFTYDLEVEGAYRSQMT